VPGDYRALIDRTGPGTLSGRLLLHKPGAPGNIGYRPVGHRRVGVGGICADGGVVGE
jgi:hypothetical protein